MSVHKQQPIGKASSQYASQGILDASLVPGSPLGDKPLYYIEKIVDHRIKNAKREFLVKWWQSSSKHEWVVEDNFHGKIPDVSLLPTSIKRKSTDAPEATRRSKRQRRIAAPIHREDEYNDPMDISPTLTRRSQRSKTLNRSVDYGEDSDEDSSSDFAKNEARLSKSSKSTARRKPKKRTVSKKSPTGYTMIEAALLCLEGEGREMHAREIAKVCIQEGWINKTKTPHNSITAALNGHIKKHGQKSSFIKAGPNIFALSPLHKRKMKSKQQKTAKSGKGSNTKGSKKKAAALDDDGEFSVPGVKPDKKSGTPKATRKHSRRKVASPVTNKKSKDSKLGLNIKTDPTFPGFKVSSNGVSSRTTRSSRVQARTTRSTTANNAKAKAKVSSMLPTHSLTNGTNGGISQPRAPYSNSMSTSYYRDAADSNFPSHPPVGAEIKITEPPPELGFNNFNGSFLDQPFDQQMAQELGDLSYAADIPTFKREVCLGLGCGVLVEYPCEAQLIQCRQCGTVMEIDTASGSLVMTSPNHGNHKHPMMDMHPSLGI